MDYQTKFEKFGNQVVGLPPDAILNCFISGLTLEIQNEMIIHRATSIYQATGLAKLIESKIKEARPNFSKPLPNPYHKSATNVSNPITHKPKIIVQAQGSLP